jgi:hypothetical protein
MHDRAALQYHNPVGQPQNLLGILLDNIEQMPPARVMVPSARSNSSTMIGASPSVGSSSSRTLD